MFSLTLSIKVKTSPIPRILSAILSGWKISRSDNFSPVPINLIGTPVTCAIDKAAPPLESPSILDIIAPVNLRSSLNFLATFTESCPAIASVRRRISSGCTLSLIFLSSSINVSSICNRPAVSIIKTS